MDTHSTYVATMRASSRSAKTNRSRRFVDGDGRGPWARRWRDLQELYADDLGGASTLSEFQLGLVATAATMRCELERFEGLLSMGQAIDTDVYGRFAGHYRRICETLGIERKQRDVSVQTIDDIAAEIEAEREANGS